MQRPSPRNRILNRNTRNQKVSTQVSSWLNFNPLSLSPLAWYDASDITTITESGGAVSQWDDKSGNNRNLTQGTSALQPVTNSATRNNKNVLVFNDNRLESISFTQTQPITIFAMCNLTTLDTDNRQVVGNDESTPGVHSPTIYTIISTWRIFAGSDFNSLVTRDSQWHCFSALFNGSSSVFRIDSRLSFLGNAGTRGYGNQRILVGGSNATAFWRGNVAELIFVPYLVPINQMIDVERYLISKWGLF